MTGHPSPPKESIGRTILVAVIIGIITGIITAAANYYFAKQSFQNQSVWTQKRDAYIKALSIVNREMAATGLTSSNLHIRIAPIRNVMPSDIETNESLTQLAMFAPTEIVHAYYNCVTMQGNAWDTNRTHLITLMRKDLNVDPTELTNIDMAYIAIDPVEQPVAEPIPPAQK